MPAGWIQHVWLIEMLILILIPTTSLSCKPSQHKPEVILLGSKQEAESWGHQTWRPLPIHCTCSNQHYSLQHPSITVLKSSHSNAAWNMAQSDSTAPATPTIWSKLSQRQGGCFVFCFLHLVAHFLYFNSGRYLLVVHTSRFFWILEESYPRLDCAIIHFSHSLWSSVLLALFKILLIWSLPMFCLSLW